MPWPIAAAGWRRGGFWPWIKDDMTQLSQGETVHVLGEGEGWSRIDFEKDTEPDLGRVAPRLIQ